MQALWQIISVFLLSTFMLVKGGVPTAIAMGFPFFEAVTITTLGGMVGTVFCVFFWDRIITAVRKRRAEKRKIKVIANPKKIFTKKNRIIIIIKQRLGLGGIAFLTPLFSYPFGCYFAVRYYQRDKQKIFIYTFASTLLWSVIPCAIKLLFS